MSRTTVLILAVVSAIFLFFALIMVVSSAREKARAAGPSTPPSRRPGPTDEALEGPLLEKYQVAGVALTVFLAVLLPFLYLREPVRQRAAADKELSESVRLGHATFEEFCARCHGPEGEGGVVKRYITPGVKGAKPTDVAAPDLREIHSRHPDDDVAAVAWEAIQRGRPPTPMPTWGVRYGGPMNDQQITDLVNYLLSIQSDDKERPLLEFEAAAGRRAI
ncbi:MAG TPA: cytochrome c [Actinomycetes bacterium]|jgi:mono/diheme cytochrome c family protein|nr:cytochrome c [Actinomycetes bacterium]HEX2155575.1 cytochrome c [Actinomycetes bacterium]